MKLGEFCPLCVNVGRRLFLSNVHWIRECNACLHRWADIGDTEGHVARVYEDGYFQHGGVGYPDYFKERSLLRDHGRRYARLLSTCEINGGSLLGVGAAAGFALQGFQDEGWECKGIEPNERMASFAVEELGIEVNCTSIEDYRDDRQYDLITMLQVLPHLVDPIAGLRRAGQLVRIGGHLLIETWNRDSFAAKVLGKRWHEYSPPSVLHWFTPKTVEHLLSELGFRQIATGRPIKAIVGAHVRSLMDHKMGQHPSLKFFAPVLSMVPENAVFRYRPGDLFWSLFKK